MRLCVCASVRRCMTCVSVYLCWSICPCVFVGPWVRIRFLLRSLGCRTVDTLVEARRYYPLVEECQDSYTTLSWGTAFVATRTTTHTKTTTAVGRIMTATRDGREQADKGLVLLFLPPAIMCLAVCLFVVVCVRVVVCCCCARPHKTSLFSVPHFYKPITFTVFFQHVLHWSPEPVPCALRALLRHCCFIGV